MPIFRQPSRLRPGGLRVTVTQFRNPITKGSTP